ncbi:MAG: alpha/beta hydrolase, partial [Hyphomicrobiales bacterium]
YTLRMITNTAPESRETVLKTFAPKSVQPTVAPLDIEWPSDVYSLAHISLPFPASDPLYGIEPDPIVSKIQLGALAFRGERGISEIPPADMLRMRWNPFHEIMFEEISRFLDLPAQ